jgi:HSP20 family protein
MMTMYISPYRRLANLREAMDRLLEENMTENAPQEREMTLAVDVIADDDAFTLRALVPGLQAEDLNIEILNNTVTIRGEFTSALGENARYINCELPEGRFSRTITLPVAVDSTKVEANIKNGVLSLVVPKAEMHRPKAIKVNVG